jgi:hypothetical protein
MVIIRHFFFKVSTYFTIQSGQIFNGWHHRSVSTSGTVLQIVSIGTIQQCEIRYAHSPMGCTESVQLLPFTSLKTEFSLSRCWIFNKMRCSSVLPGSIVQIGFCEQSRLSGKYCSFSNETDFVCLLQFTITYSCSITSQFWRCNVG